MQDWQVWIEGAPPLAGDIHPHFRRKIIGKAIIHRDQVHGDVQYDRLSVELLNTAALQRLGRVYQLGYSHLVFRGGTHTRLSHVMGAAHMGGAIVDALKLNYSHRRAAQPRHVAPPVEFLPGNGQEADGWDALRHLVTWAALLHDVGHVPLGHTLEDEFEGIFKKHDDFASPRSLHLWGQDSELFGVLTNSSLYPDSFKACDIQPIQVWQIVLLICFYKDVDPDPEDRYSDFKSYIQHRINSVDSQMRELDSQMKGKTLTSDEKGDRLQKQGALETEKSFAALLAEAVRNTSGLFHPFMTDIVANTICADYLDYLRRDPLNVGLDVLRDDRILSHFYVSTEPKSKSKEKAYRMALALLDRNGKPRLDVCTGVVEQVRQRYRFAELIYYHKTKVAASAMFAKAMALIGKPKEISIDQIPLYEADVPLDAVARILATRSEKFAHFKTVCLPSSLMHPEIGDDSLHLFMMHAALDNIEKLIPPRQGKFTRGSTRLESAMRATKIESQLRGIALLQSIVRRRLYKVSVSISARQFGRLTKGASPSLVVEERLKRMLYQLRDDKVKKNLRGRIEADMAIAAGWPSDSILLYVPPRKSQAKGIDTFAFDKDGVVRLNEHPAVSEKVNELSKDYQNLWRLLVLTHPAYQDRTIGLSEAIDVLIMSLWSDFGDSELEVDLHNEARVATIREVSRFAYIRKDHRQAAAQMEDLSMEPEGGMRRIDWQFFERAVVQSTRSEEIFTSREYAERAFLMQCLLEMFGGDAIAEDRAIAAVRQQFPAPGSAIVPRNRKEVAEDLKSRLTAKNLSLTGKQRADLRRALELQKVAEELFAEGSFGHQTHGRTGAQSPGAKS